MVLFLAVKAKQQSVEQKIKNYLTKWRQVQQKIPLPEMTELLITPQLPEYPKIAHDVFMLLLDGKLRSRTETLKFLKPFAPPPPPPLPAPRRGRAAKAVAEAPTAAGKPGAKAGKKAKGAAVATPAAAVPAPAMPQPAKAQAKAPEKSKLEKSKSEKTSPKPAKSAAKPAKKPAPKSAAKPTKGKKKR
jgi:tRNA nucleotidyltransferase (CCA-adding enzyme)